MFEMAFVEKIVSWAGTGVLLIWALSLTWLAAAGYSFVSDLRGKRRLVR